MIHWKKFLILKFYISIKSIISSNKIIPLKYNYLREWLKCTSQKRQAEKLIQMQEYY